MFALLREACSEICPHRAAERAKRGSYARVLLFLLLTPVGIVPGFFLSARSTSAQLFLFFLLSLAGNLPLFSTRSTSAFVRSRKLLVEFTAGFLHLSGMMFNIRSFLARMPSRLHEAMAQGFVTSYYLKKPRRFVAAVHERWTAAGLRAHESCRVVQATLLTLAQAGGREGFL